MAPYVPRGHLEPRGPLSSPKALPSSLLTGPLLVGEANTLFRSNSLASKSMESFLKVRCTVYVIPPL